MNAQLRMFDPARDVQGLVNLYNTVFGPLRPYYSWPLTPERFADKVLGSWEFRREGLWLAEDQGRLVGFIIASYRDKPLLANDDVTGDMGPVFISAVGVAADHRGRGVGRALVAKVVEFARLAGRTRVTISANPRAPMAFFIGVQEDWRDAQKFLTSVGFNFSAMMQNMVRGIAGYTLEAPTQAKVAALAAQGYQCRAYQEQDFAALSALLDDHGWPYWNLDLLSKVGRWKVTRPFMETCFLEVGADEIYGPDDIGVVMKDGRMLSFCAQTLNPRKRVAYLGPMLTAKDARKLGLGSVALQISLVQAAAKGMIACDLWTGAGGGITHFYKHSGFEQVVNWLDYDMRLTQ